MAGKHRKQHPLVVGLRTTGGIVAGAAVIGVAAAGTQAFAGEGGTSPDRTGSSWAAGAASAAHERTGGRAADRKEPKKAAPKASSGAKAQQAQRKKPTADDAIEVARDQVGISENGDGQTKFQDWYMSTERAQQTVQRDGGSIKGYDDAQWCSMFISWIGEQIGFTDQIGSDAWTIAHARWFQDNDRWGDEPEPGAIVFFAWDGGKGLGDIQHVGMVVEDLGDGRVRTVEGNTSNAVKVRERSAGQIVGYGYPDYAK
ncbi:CHAP domain-containing protein [Actinomadura sp. 9N407]|uniref:CHAP domain-containing protein n=1 Tax=Actinomadura sp. 9N407 TaxID=3375154 RepID=UPI0037AE23B4